MKTQFSIARALAALLVLILSAGTSVSGLADSKVIPGSACLPTGNIDQYVRNPAYGDYYPFRFGNGSYRQTVCPILREKTGNNPIYKITVNFHVGSSDDKSSLNCSFLSYSPNGDLVASKYVTATNRFVLNRKKISLTAKNLQTVPNGHALVRCNHIGYYLVSVFWNE